MTQAATGSRALVAVGREQAFGVPDSTDLTYYRPNLPVGGGLNRSENPSGAVNRSGYRERGVPGGIEGAFEFGHRLTSAHLLDFLEHVLGAPVKAEPQTDVFTYTFSGDADTLTSLWALLALAPVQRELQYGVYAGGYEFEFGDNEPLDFRLVDPVVSHGTSFGLAVTHGSADGTYAAGPFARGIVQAGGLGSVWVQVTSVVGGLAVKIHQTTGEPTFPSPAITLPYDGATSEQYYASLQGAITLAGTVTVGAGAAVVTGTGTEFTAYDWLTAGVIVDIDGEAIAILTVDSDTQITLAANHTAGATDVAIIATRRDIGFITENKDPFEAIFPGTAAGHLSGMSLALTGTVEIAGTAVTGTGTAFTTELTLGDVLIAGGVERVVSAITSDTAATLATSHPGATAGSAARRLVTTTSLTGTVTIVGTAVTGSGTAFDDEILAGETLRVGGVDRVVASVGSATAITLATAHPGADAGSTAQRVANLYEFPETWADPTPTYITGFDVFTSAHVDVRYRRRATDDWIVTQGVSGTYRNLWEVTPETGFGSRYQTAQDRDGELYAELEITRNYRSRDLLDFAQSHRRFLLELRLLGRQLGDGTLREGIVFAHPAAGISEREGSAQEAGRVEESVTIVGETNDAGDSPVTVTVTTTRDWTAYA